MPWHHPLGLRGLGLYYRGYPYLAVRPIKARPSVPRWLRIPLGRKLSEGSSFPPTTDYDNPGSDALAGFPTKAGGGAPQPRKTLPGCRPARGGAILPERTPLRTSPITGVKRECHARVRASTRLCRAETPGAPTWRCGYMVLPRSGLQLRPNSPLRAASGSSPARP